MTLCRVGVIGAGNVAQRHARVLASFDDVRIVGVTDVVAGAAERLAAAHGAVAFPDVEALLAAGVDAVYVCVPPFAHGIPEEAVLAAGLPLFVEKPIGVDVDTALHIARLVEQRQVITAVGHHWRYLHVVEEARRVIADRPIRLITCSWLDKVPPVAWWPRRDRSGGQTVEQAAHVLDLARALAGEVAEVYAVGNPTPPNVVGADVDCATAATLWFASGAVGALATTCALSWKQRAGLEIHADDLWLAVGEDGLSVRDGDTEWHVPGDPEAARVAVDRAFIDAVRGTGDDVRVPYAEALRTHLLATAVARSAATRQAVRLPPVELANV